MERKTFTELLGGKSDDELFIEFDHIRYIREEIEQNRMKEWHPYKKWLTLYHQAIAAALEDDWQGVAIFGTYANCERYPEHLTTIS